MDFWKKAKYYPMSKVHTAMAGHYKFLKRNRFKKDVSAEKELRPFVVPPDPQKKEEAELNNRFKKTIT